MPEIRPKRCSRRRLGACKPMRTLSCTLDTGAEVHRIPGKRWAEISWTFAWSLRDRQDALPRPDPRHRVLTLVRLVDTTRSFSDAAESRHATSRGRRCTGVASCCTSCGCTKGYRPGGMGVGLYCLVIDRKTTGRRMCSHAEMRAFGHADEAPVALGRRVPMPPQSGTIAGCVARSFPATTARGRGAPSSCRWCCP